MFLDINHQLGIEQSEELKGKMVAACSSNTDGSFLIHHFLTMFLKQNQPVCFLTLGQSFGHYNAVALKLGVNLKTARDSDQLHVVEGLKLFRTRLYNPAKNANPSVNLFDFLEREDGSLQSMYNILKEVFIDASQRGSCALLLIDDIRVLTSVGASGKQVMTMMHQLRHMVAGYGGCLATLLSTDRYGEDEVNALLWRWFCHESDLTIHMYGLDSGYCKEVHGEMAICWRCTSYSRSDKVMQFKVQDKSVALFAPGTSAAIL